MKLKNIIEMFLKDGIIDGSEGQVEVIKAIHENFTLLHKTKESDLFDLPLHNIDLEFFDESLTEEEKNIYQTLWNSGVRDWRENTDSRFGPFAFVALDAFIVFYIRLRKMAWKDMVNLTPGSPTFVADVIFQKQQEFIAKHWPKAKPEKKSKKKLKGKKDEVDDAEEKEESGKVWAYEYNGKLMNEEEYQEWYATIEESRKADILGHVKQVLVNADQLNDKS